MTTPLSPATITRLEKTAVDNGFDLEHSRVSTPAGDWLCFASAQALLRLWLSTFGGARSRPQLGIP
jgi:hypothetical protein